MSLQDGRAFVELNAMFYLGSKGISSISLDDETSRERFAEELEVAAGRFFLDGKFPTAQEHTWARVPGFAERRDILNLRSCILRLRDDSGPLLNPRV